MATDFLVKQGRVMSGVRLVTDADVAHQTDLTNIREIGTTSSQAISAGTYFYLNGTLVRAKVDIANGATFTLNTNYEVVTAGALNEINNKFNYSETEHVVGKWIDGSDLYAKSINSGALPNTGNKLVPCSISNLKNIIDIKGIGWVGTTVAITMPFIQINGNTVQAISFNYTNGNINIVTSYDASSVTQSYLTVFYTKTS